jgi:hypothetical protein
MLESNGNENPKYWSMALSIEIIAFLEQSGIVKD